MSLGKARRRGQPLVVLAAMLLAWIGTRAMTWDSPAVPEVAAASDALPLAASRPSVAARQARPTAPHAPVQAAPWPLEASLPAPVEPLPEWGFVPRSEPRPGQSAEVMAGHQALWLAATSALPVPSDIAALLHGNADMAAYPTDTGPQDRALVARPPENPHWSFDSWLLVRPGGRTAGGTGAFPASYGASQAGAILRYRLAPDDEHRPALYLRATQALAAGRESEGAAGISIRPLPGVPVAFYSELRVASGGGPGVSVRPAAFAVTELPRVALPLGARGEAYVQGGYVGGDFATGFVDGQARADRAVARFDLGEVRAGVGAWGGAQQGAARLDIGPTASLDLRVGEAPARVALDYRLRVAGDAAPGSGIALTLSTGF